MIPKAYIDAKIAEFDKLYITDNLWKSDDETMAYAPIEGVRQWVFDALHSTIQERDAEIAELVKVVASTHIATLPTARDAYVELDNAIKRDTVRLFRDNLLDAFTSAKQEPPEPPLAV